ncbi:MAG: terminase small subunit [Phage 5P_3]|nr:MAG: terminase small subunit [Phage 5P_3]
MPGPAPTPTKLKELRGNPGKRALNAHEPQPRAAKVTCPRWLPTAAKREWRRIAPELVRLGLLTVADRAALAAYCEAWAEAIMAHQALQREGYTFETEKGYRGVHPLVAVKNKALLRMRAFGAEFGMTPSARARLSVEPPTPLDPFESFLNAVNEEPADE